MNVIFGIEITSRSLSNHDLAERLRMSLDRRWISDICITRRERKWLPRFLNRKVVCVYYECRCDHGELTALCQVLLDITVSKIVIRAGRYKVVEVPYDCSEEDLGHLVGALYYVDREHLRHTDIRIFTS